MLYLDVEDAVLVARIAGRGEDRADDSEEVVAKRLEVYREQTAPLVSHYGAQGSLRRIDGDQSIDAVYADVLATVNGEPAA